MLAPTSDLVWSGQVEFACDRDEYPAMGGGVRGHRVQKCRLRCWGSKSVMEGPAVATVPLQWWGLKPGWGSGVERM